MTYTTVQRFLETIIPARERRNRANAVWRLVFGSREEITRKEYIANVAELNSADRLIRKVQEEHEELRGDDYPDKDKYEQQHILNMGYEVGYREDTSRARR
jgi:hypothetical protein